ncbi:MAG: hypothetical protein AAFO57_02700 [Pseudomonadota bacterium]
MGTPLEGHFARTLAVSILSLGAFLFGPGTSVAQSCEATGFGKQSGQIYLSAENALLRDENPAQALAYLNQLRAGTLNCYEEGAVLRLSAAVKVESGEDYAGAIQDLKTAMARGYMSNEEAVKTQYNIAQLHMSLREYRQAAAYLNRWVELGGVPDRDQKWRLAVINQKSGDDATALQWAEQVFEDDGPGADEEVYNFLIFLYGQTGQQEKAARLLSALQSRRDRRDSSPGGGDAE